MRLRDLRASLGRRLVPLWFNLRRRLALVGWRRADGPRTRAGAVVRQPRTEEAVPVVVCVWRRPHRLARTIECLAAQSRGPVRLCLWNNNPSLRELVDTTAAGVSTLDVDVVHSSRNVGGFGRFYFARRIAHEHPFVIFLDDDQAPGPDVLETLLREWRPRSAVSTWGFRFRGRNRYSDRYPADPGQRVKYCGTRGMICDTSAFLHPAVFECPKRYWFVEDLWLSYVLDETFGWPLYKSAATIDTDADEHDQYRFLGPTKDRFHRYLVRRGWDPALPDVSGDDVGPG
jgi:hypothetical protein